MQMWCNILSSYANPACILVYCIHILLQSCKIRMLQVTICNLIALEGMHSRMRCCYAHSYTCVWLYMSTRAIRLPIEKKLQRQTCMSYWHKPKAKHASGCCLCKCTKLHANFPLLYRKLTVCRIVTVEKNWKSNRIEALKQTFVA